MNLNKQLTLRLAESDIVALNRVSQLFGKSVNELLRDVVRILNDNTQEAVTSLVQGRQALLEALRALIDQDIKIQSQVASTSVGSSPAGLDSLFAKEK